MSRDESPTVSSTLPISSPSRSTTLQPGSIISHETGSGIRRTGLRRTTRVPACRRGACPRARAGCGSGRGSLRRRAVPDSGAPSRARRRTRTGARSGSGTPSSLRIGPDSAARLGARRARGSPSRPARARRRGRSSPMAAPGAGAPRPRPARPARVRPPLRLRPSSPRRARTRRRSSRGRAAATAAGRGPVSSHGRRGPRRGRSACRGGRALPGRAAPRRARSRHRRGSSGAGGPRSSPPGGRARSPAACRRGPRAESMLTVVAKVERKGTLSEERLREFFREMLLIRRFEEKVEERFRAGELPGFLHVALGQEAVAVGVCRALEDGDVIASTHRAHGHTLAKGTHPNEVLAELYGKVEGCCHGYGGSMHLYDVERGNLGAHAVVGGGLPATVGAALAFKFRDEPRVAVAFFGDGATNIGTFHESLNLAHLWHVPAVFVCENNHWAVSTPAHQQLPID